MKHLALLPLLVGCGRVGFAGAPDAAPLDDADLTDAGPANRVAFFAMDDDPATGHAAALPAELAASCIPGVNCPTAAPAAGHRGGAYAFSGTQGLYLPAPHALGAAPFTFAAWVEPTAFSTTDFGGVVAKPTATDELTDVVAVQLDGTDGTLQFETTGADGTSHVYTKSPSNAVALGRWDHVAITWDGAAQRIYIDGALVTTSATPVLFDRASPILLGTDADRGVLHAGFMGLLDEVALFDRALADAEIAALAAD